MYLTYNMFCHIYIIDVPKGIDKISFYVIINLINLRGKVKFLTGGCARAHTGASISAG